MSRNTLCLLEYNAACTVQMCMKCVHSIYDLNSSDRERCEINVISLLCLQISFTDPAAEEFIFIFISIYPACIIYPCGWHVMRFLKSFVYPLQIMWRTDEDSYGYLWMCSEPTCTPTTCKNFTARQDLVFILFLCGKCLTEREKIQTMCTIVFT